MEGCAAATSRAASAISRSSFGGAAPDCVGEEGDEDGEDHEADYCEYACYCACVLEKSR
jgi:hypothetical protein